MRLARARLWQVPRLAAILWAFSRETPWLPRVRSRWADLWTLAVVVRRGWVRVARVGGRIAGFLVRDGSRVHALYVCPRARGQGVGRALLSEAKAVGALDLWVLVANAPARRFYAAQGFAELEHAQGGGNDEGLPDILMTWREGRGA
ncbi:MAG: GNAT family N-acetyltransferase [Roseovarius sp.]|nr:GNAT family N-acetyltransferase [Roseovarius sp.]